MLWLVSYSDKFGRLIKDKQIVIDGQTALIRDLEHQIQLI
jgi:hypothetical protein